ncbi:hypothetical protein ABZ513_26700 [Streptomyces bacillaris]|uniref:hypothetical protein n=1 Tax=Streptomyces bacillaris TaxID=68179 RepID=UPI00345FD652
MERGPHPNRRPRKGKPWSSGLSVISWYGSLKGPATMARADRWGIFIGEWAPTFFGLGLALANYERDHDHHHSTTH